MAHKVKVIDGGFATQLSVHVGESVDGDPLWSARFNATDPSSVIQSHYDFLKGKNTHFRIIQRQDDIVVFGINCFIIQISQNSSTHSRRLSDV